MYAESTLNLLVVVVITLAKICHGQEGPFFNITPYQSGIIERQDFCERYSLVKERNLTIKDALEGMNIHVALFDFQLDYLGYINPDNPPIAVRILDELARRAKFNWRNTYGIMREPNSKNNETFTTAADWMASVYDLIGEYYTITPARLERGFIFVAEGWIDSNVIMIRKKELNDDFKIWSFAKPFSTEVWCLLVATIIVSGLVYFFLDGLDSIRLEEKMDHTFTTSLFAAANSFLGQGDFSPKSVPTRLVVLSSAFTFCLFISAYTANLASFLVVRKSGGFAIEDLQDAVENKLRICVWDGTATATLFKEKYPDYKRLFLTETEPATLIEVQNGNCDIAIMYASEWKQFEKDIDMNPDCALEQTGRVISESGSAFVLSEDINYCSFFLREVLNAHFIEMVYDGTLRKIWDEFMDESATIDCSLVRKNKEKEEDSLNIANMGGIVIFHGFGLLLALMISIIMFCNEPKSKRKVVKQKISMVFGSSEFMEPSLRRKNSLTSDTGETENNGDSSNNNMISKVPGIHSTLTSQEVLTQIQELINTLHEENYKASFAGSLTSPILNESSNEKVTARELKAAEERILSHIADFEERIDAKITSVLK